MRARPGPRSAIPAADVTDEACLGWITSKKPPPGCGSWMGWAEPRTHRQMLNQHRRLGSPSSVSLFLLERVEVGVIEPRNGAIDRHGFPGQQTSRGEGVRFSTTTTTTTGLAKILRCTARWASHHFVYSGTNPVCNLCAIEEASRMDPGRPAERGEEQTDAAADYSWLFALADRNTAPPPSSSFSAVLRRGEGPRG